MGSKSRETTNTLVLHLADSFHQAGVVHIHRQKHIWSQTSSISSTPSSSSSSSPSDSSSSSSPSDSSPKALIEIYYSWRRARCNPNEASVPRKAVVSSHLPGFPLFYAVLMILSKLPRLNQHVTMVSTNISPWSFQHAWQRFRVHNIVLNVELETQKSWKQTHSLKFSFLV